MRVGRSRSIAVKGSLVKQVWANRLEGHEVNHDNWERLMLSRSDCA